MDGHDAFGAWAPGMKRLAEETGAFCKLSGLVTEGHENWTADNLRPFADHVLDSFGPSRVMWGSDWPVCQLRAPYDRWMETAHQFCAHLDGPAHARIFGGTAADFYRIEG